MPKVFRCIRGGHTVLIGAAVNSIGAPLSGMSASAIMAELDRSMIDVMERHGYSVTDDKDHIALIE